MITTGYEISGDVDLTIAIVADLHEHDPNGVLQILKEEHPDVIAVPGDLFENHEFGENLDKEDGSFISRLLCAVIHYTNKLAGLRWREKHNIKKEHAYRFLREAGKIAPVVMSLGNHELYLTEQDREIMNAAGVTLLDDSTVEINGAIFGGIPSKQTSGRIDNDFLKWFSSQEGYKVLLCHHPEYYDQIKDYPIDLILSGHCHGGQIRVCGRGIFSPGQGLFPKYHHGVYDGRLVVSSGCSNTASIPRWGNAPEVVIVRLGDCCGV